MRPGQRLCLVNEMEGCGRRADMLRGRKMWRGWIEHGEDLRSSLHEEGMLLGYLSCGIIDMRYLELLVRYHSNVRNH